MKIKQVITFLALLALSGSLICAAPLGTAFTYQGRLNDAGAPAHGSYDLRLTIYDAPTEGSAVGGVLTNTATPVASGLFAVTLDFGSGVFTGEARWLEIGVRTNGSLDDFTTLSPRQPLTPTPYALLAGNVPAGAIGNAQLASGAVNASNIMTGTITAQQLAPNSAFSNLYAGGQSGVAYGGVVMSEDPNNQALLNAGYVRLGSATSLSVTEEAWRSLPSPPAATAQPVEGREWHTAIWTGSEMIVWGGYNDGGTLNTGARYDPAVNAWTAVSQTNAPSARFNHSAVWTGTQMIIWGGQPGLEEEGLNTGKRYNPATDVWTSMSTVNAPTGRYGHAAVCSGTVMVVWGGHGELRTWSVPFDPGTQYSSDLAQDGGRYNLTTGTWSAVRTNNAPSPRAQSCVVWTGSEMIVWGGFYSEHVSSMIGEGTTEYALNDGGRYNPVTDTWNSVSATGAPAARYRAAAVWANTRMIVWGGSDESGVVGGGGRYDPSANTWASVSLALAPAPRMDPAAVWTGSRMVVWGGEASDTALGTGGRYDPSANAWYSVSTTGAPVARRNPTAVWTGSRMLVWGGREQAENEYLGVGGRYDPTNNIWSELSAMPAYSEPWPRRSATAVWTGSEMIVWGGEDDSQYLRSGARFNPAANAWSALPITNAPAARTDHTAVWTGTEMLVWGGFNGRVLGNGARYHVAQDSWSAIATNGAPTARRAHTAVWTGDEMLIWGGYTRAGKLNTFPGTGGRYEPGHDRWSPIGTNGAPVGRASHTAVWTGNEMIVWGGHSETGSILSGVVTNYLDSGARYRPDLDLLPLSRPWAATSIPRTIAPRRAHTAVWTGAEMIVWGGEDGSVLNTGYRYRPDANTWSAIALSGAPSARQDHIAVWTGMHMLIWGGRMGSTVRGSGARYNPTFNTWGPITTSGAPSPRYDHSAVWTDKEMLVWGGGDGGDYYDNLKGYTPPVILYLYIKP